MNTQIKAEELRRGNLIVSNRVYFDKPTTGRVTAVSSAVVWFEHDYYGETRSISNPYNAISGLPITEELLLKAGFEKNHRKGIFKNVNNNYWVNNCVCLFYTETPPENTYLLGYGFMHDGEYYASTSQWIHYVHELQNAYRVLTGKELTL